jgi:hypothetical protein
MRMLHARLLLLAGASLLAAGVQAQDAASSPPVAQPAAADPLWSGFQSPPESARPRVWGTGSRVMSANSRLCRFLCVAFLKPERSTGAGRA